MSVRPNYAVIWDVDGTLVDTGELHFQAWQRLAGEIGKVYSRDDFAATFGWRNVEIFPHVFGPQYSPAEIDELGARKELYYRAEAEKGLDLLPGVLDLVKGLKEAGIAQAVGSSAPRGNVDLILAMTGLDQYITASVAMEDVSRGKPDPEVFVTAAKRLGVPPAQCLVFEDAPVGIRAAKTGGMKAVGITFVKHHPREKLAAEGADLVVGCLREMTPAKVLEILQRES
jgi:beta-phosphoglucomutase